MKPVARAILVFFVLAALILVTFALFGDRMESLFSLEASREWMSRHRGWAGPAGAGLLVADLLLPIPTTVVIGALGAVLGVAGGFLWGWLGLCLAGFAGYGLARLGGPRLADKLCPPSERARYQQWFDTWGGLAVVVTRLLPILPEVFSVMAGLYGMHVARFAFALLLGSLPPALAYAWVGSVAREHPGPAVWGLVGLTAFAWIAFIQTSRRRR